MSRPRRRNTRLILTLSALALAVLLLRAFVFHIVRIEGSSMEPGLNNGELVLVTTFDYCLTRTPKRGDIVECSFPERSGGYIKRVIGLPGDHVQIMDGCVYIDGAAYTEPYASGPMEDYEAILDDDEYLVMGDNRPQSYDGRAEDMGFIHSADFKGRVRLKLWPLEWIA